MNRRGERQVRRALVFTCGSRLLQVTFTSLLNTFCHSQCHDSVRCITNVCSLICFCYNKAYRQNANLFADSHRLLTRESYCCQLLCLCEVNEVVRTRTHGSELLTRDSGDNDVRPQTPSATSPFKDNQSGYLVPQSGPPITSGALRRDPRTLTENRSRYLPNAKQMATSQPKCSVPTVSLCDLLSSGSDTNAVRRTTACQVIRLTTDAQSLVQPFLHIPAGTHQPSDTHKTLLSVAR